MEKLDKLYTTFNREGFDDQELAEPISETTEYELESLLKLARNCPGEAITIFAESGEIIDHS
jgi:hypothetical protein